MCSYVTLKNILKIIEKLIECFWQNNDSFFPQITTSPHVPTIDYIKFDFLLQNYMLTHVIFIYLLIIVNWLFLDKIINMNGIILKNLFILLIQEREYFVIYDGHFKIICQLLCNSLITFKRLSVATYSNSALPMNWFILERGITLSH